MPPKPRIGRAAASRSSTRYPDTSPPHFPASPPGRRGLSARRRASSAGSIPEVSDLEIIRLQAVIYQLNTSQERDEVVVRAVISRIERFKQNLVQFDLEYKDLECASETLDEDYNTRVLELERIKDMISFFKLDEEYKEYILQLEKQLADVIAKLKHNEFQDTEYDDSAFVLTGHVVGMGSPDEAPGPTPVSSPSPRTPVCWKKTAKQGVAATKAHVKRTVEAVKKELFAGLKRDNKELTDQLLELNKGNKSIGEKMDHATANASNAYNIAGKVENQVSALEKRLLGVEAKINHSHDILIRKIKDEIDTTADRINDVQERVVSLSQVVGTSKSHEVMLKNDLAGMEARLRDVELKLLNTQLNPDPQPAPHSEINEICQKMETLDAIIKSVMDRQARTMTNDAGDMLNRRVEELAGCISSLRSRNPGSNPGPESPRSSSFVKEQMVTRARVEVE